MKKITIELEKPFVPSSLQQCKYTPDTLCTTVKDILEALQPLYKPVTPNRIDFTEDDWENAEHITPAELDTLAAKHITYLSKLIEMCKAALLGIQQNKPPASALAGLGPTAVCQIMHVCLVAYEHLLLAPKLKDALVQQKYIVESNAIALVSGMLSLGLLDAASALCMRIRRSLACREKIQRSKETRISHGKDDTPGLAEIVIKLLYLETQCIFARHGPYEQAFASYESEWTEWMHFYKKGATEKGDEYEKRFRGLVTKNVSKAFTYGSTPPCTLEDAQKLVNILACVSSTNQSEFFGIAIKWERETKRDGRSLYISTAKAAKRARLLPLAGASTLQQFCENYVFWCAACMQSFARNHTNKSDNNEDISFAEQVYTECSAYIARYREQPLFYSALIGVCAADLHVSEGGETKLKEAEDILNGTAREVLDNTEALKKFTKTQIVHIKWALYALRKNIKSKCRPFVPNGVVVSKGLLSGFGVAMYGLAKVALLVPRGNSEGNNTVNNNNNKSNDSNSGSNSHRTLGPRYEWFEHASLAIKSFFAAGEYNELRRVAKFVHRHSPFTNEKNDDSNEKKPDGTSEDTQVARLAFILLRSHGVALHNEREYAIAADLLGKSVDILRKQHPQVQADNNLDEAYLFAAASRQALGGEDNLSAALGGYAASVVCNLRFRRAQPPKSAVERYMRLCTAAFPRDVSKVILLLDSVARAENNNVSNNKEWVLCVSKIQLGICRDMCLPFSFHLCILNHVINTTYASGRMRDYAAALVSKALINRTLQLARRKTFPDNDTPCALLRRAISSVFSSNSNEDSDEDYEDGDNTKVNKTADGDEALLCTLAEAYTWLGICTLERKLKPSEVPRKSSFVTETNLSELLDGADDALHYLHHGLYLWKVLSEHLYGIASNKNSDSAVQLPSPEQLQAIQYLVDVFAVLGDFQAQIEAATCGIHFAETILSRDPQTWVQPGCNVQMSRNNVITALVNIRLSLARTYDMFGRHAAAERAISMAESDAAPLSEEGGTSTTTTTFDRDSAFCSNIRLYILAGRLRHNTSIYGVHHRHHDSKNGDVRKLFCEADLALRELSSRVDVCKTWGAYVIRSELEHAVASALLLHGRPDDAQAAATASLDHKLRVSAVVMPGLASSGPAAGGSSSSAQNSSVEATDQLLGEVRFRPYASDWRVLEGASESLAQLAAINVVQEALSAANVAMLRGAALGAATAIPRLYWLHVQEVAELESRRGNADTCEKYAGLLEPALKRVRGKQALGQSPEYAVYERRLGDFARRAGRPAAESLEWYRRAKSTLEGSMKVGTIQRRADAMKRVIATPQRSTYTDAALEDAFIESFKYHSPPAKKVCLRLSGVDEEDKGLFPINSTDTIKAEITCCEADLRKTEWSKKESDNNEDLSEEAEDAVKKMVEKAAKERIRPDIRAKLRLIHASLLTRKGSRKNACKVAKDAYEKALLSQREPLLLHKAATLYAEAKCLVLKDTLFTDDDSEITDIAFLLNAAQGVSFCQQMARQEEEREEDEDDDDDDDEEDKMNSDEDSGECSGIHRRHQLRARFLAKTPGRHIASRVAQEVKGRKRKSFRRNADKCEKRRISLFDMFAGENRRNFLTRYVDSLPKEWTIVSVTQVDNGLLITRLRPGCRAVVKIAATSATTTEKLVSELRNFVTKNRDTAVAAAETDTDKMSWSAVRGSLNNEMRRFISRIEDTVLGSVKALLVGPYCEPIVEAALCAQVDELLQKNAWMPVRNPRVRDVLLLVMNAMPYLTQSDIKYWASTFVDASFCPGMEEANTSALAQDLSDFHSAALENAFRVAKKAGCLGPAYASVPDQKEAHTSWAKSLSRGPVILVLDRAVQELPWESIPCLAAHPVTRVPSIAFAAALGSSITQQHEDESGEIDDIFTPQTPRSSHHRPRYAEDDEVSGTSTEKDDDGGGMTGVISKHRANRGIVQNGVCMDKVLYILDPKQNLPVLVEEMRPVVEANPKWVGTISAPPPPAHELRDQAARADIFMYCGHGSGETYLPSNEIAALPDATAPVAMLMGCSSSKLFDNGDFEPTGAPTHWLCAGSPAVIGFLWEATDKNADTLTQALLSFWTGIAPIDRHKNPQMKQEEGTDGVELANNEMQTTSLPEALARARQRCSFEYLIGAAAVYYGVPVYCKKLSSDVAATLSAATSSAFRRKSKSRIPVKEKGRKNPYLTPYTARSSRILCCSKSDSGMTEDLPLQKQ